MQIAADEVDALNIAARPDIGEQADVLRELAQTLFKIQVADLMPAAQERAGEGVPVVFADGLPARAAPSPGRLP